MYAPVVAGSGVLALPVRPNTKWKRPPTRATVANGTRQKVDRWTVDGRGPVAMASMSMDLTSHGDERND